MQNQAKQETESRESLATEQQAETSAWPEAKRLFLLLLDELRSTERFKNKGDTFFFSVRHNTGSELVIHASDWAGCDVSAPTMRELLDRIREFNPEAERQKKIAAIKAELAKLEAEVSTMEGGSN
jgi:hypothetical protein